MVAGQRVLRDIPRIVPGFLEGWRWDRRSTRHHDASGLFEKAGRARDPLELDLPGGPLSRILREHREPDRPKQRIGNLGRFRHARARDSPSKHELDPRSAPVPVREDPAQRDRALGEAE